MSCGNTTAEQLVIGDDYLIANARGLIVNVCAVTGMTTAASAKIGFADNANTLEITGGVITDAGNGIWVIQFNVTKEQTASLPPGRYDWSVELSQSGKEITVAKSINYDTQIQWVEKQT